MLQNDGCISGSFHEEKEISYHKSLSRKSSIKHNHIDHRKTGKFFELVITRQKEFFSQQSFTKKIINSTF